MATVPSLYSCLLFLFHLLLPGCLSQRPPNGAALYLENGEDSRLPAGQQLQNNTLISGDSLSLTYGLACYSAVRDTNTIGEWRFPNGSTVVGGNPAAIDDQVPVVFTHRQLGRVTLQIRDGHRFTSALEGVYTCTIPDETGTVRTLYAGVYASSGGPVVASPVQFRLLSHDFDYPPTFTVNCTTTDFPPTVLIWSLNGSPIDFTPTSSFSSSQQLRDTLSSTYDSILTVSGANPGQYSCSMSNERGTNSANITVKAPSGAPTNVNLSPVGNNSVQVSWTPPAGDVRGYRVFYSDGSLTRTLSVGNVDTGVVRDLSLGVEYSITVQAFADFPGPNSTADTVTLTAASPPQQVNVVSESATSLTVSWSASASGGVTGYEVSYSPVEGSCEGVAGGREVVEGGRVLTTSLSGLQAYTEYSVTVRSRNADGFGVPSTARSERTMADTAEPPQVVSVTARSSPRGFTVRWVELTCGEVNDDKVNGYMVRYGLLSETQQVTTPLISGSTHSISDPNLQVFVEYSVEVAAINSLGAGQFSQPETVVIPGTPGPVSELYTTPDVLSVVLNWAHPQQGAGHITAYEIRHSQDIFATLSGFNRASGELTSFRITMLQPDTVYQFEIRAVIGLMEGSPQQVTERTLTIGRVQGVSVRQLNSSAVNISWSRLDSEDVFYRVYYFNPDGQVDFNSSSSWGIVKRVNSETQFQVVALVFIQGQLTEGQRSDLVCISCVTCNSSSSSSNEDAHLLPTLVPTLLLLAVWISTVIIMSSILVIMHRRLKAKGPAKENIDCDMKKCEAYEAVKMSSLVNNSEREYETVDNVNTMS